jgi:hypothetical protein
MLKEEDVEILMGRASGGDFMRIMHKPTGISRAEGPPLREPRKARAKMLREIETELVERGL